MKTTVKIVFRRCYGIQSNSESVTQHCLALLISKGFSGKEECDILTQAFITDVVLVFVQCSQGNEREAGNASTERDPFHDEAGGELRRSLRGPDQAPT